MERLRRMRGVGAAGGCNSLRRSQWWCPHSLYSLYSLYTLATFYGPLAKMKAQVLEAYLILKCASALECACWTSAS
jgi:hypothetical protein